MKYNFGIPFGIMKSNKKETNKNSGIMKQVLAIILMAGLTNFSIATEKEVARETGLHHISSIELDMLIDLIDEVENYQGEYTVEVYNSNGELVQKDSFHYESPANENQIGYRSDYTIRLNLQGGVTHDFVLRD